MKLANSEQPQGIDARRVRRNGKRVPDPSSSMVRGRVLSVGEVTIRLIMMSVTHYGGRVMRYGIRMVGMILMAICIASLSFASDARTKRLESMLGKYDFVMYNMGTVVYDEIKKGHKTLLEEKEINEGKALILTYLDKDPKHDGAFAKMQYQFHLPEKILTAGRIWYYSEKTEEYALETYKSMVNMWTAILGNPNILRDHARECVWFRRPTVGLRMQFIPATKQEPAQTFYEVYLLREPYQLTMPY